MSERIADVDRVATQLVTPNADPTYQASLVRAKSSTFLAVDAVTTTVSFLDGLLINYQSIIGTLDAVLNVSIPVKVRVFLFDALCAPDNVSMLVALDDECFDNNNYCQLSAMPFCRQRARESNRLIGRRSQTRRSSR